MKEGNYNPKVIEEKWQKIWQDEKAFAASDDFSKPKYYALVEFPYPSGQGLHVGHPRPYTGLDIIARKKRLEGFNVMYPMGWDAFGLPTENYAIKNKIHPKIVTKNNIERFKKQLQSLGFSFDWAREVNTTDPNYYKWTQWIFLKLFEKGLAYKTEMPINFCTECKVGLANEEVVNDVCERCGSEVIKKSKSQWMLKITDYAEKLLADLESLDYIERIKTQQINWIGRSEGAEIDFSLVGRNSCIKVFTTRADTIFGASFLVISPENVIIDELKDSILNLNEVAEYQDFTIKKSDAERADATKEKTGVELKGIRAIHPITGTQIPVWIADYVLNYGTGAIMAVPGHDSRDWEFAKKYKLPIIEVVGGGNVDEKAYESENGILKNSNFLDGHSVNEAIQIMLEWLELNKKGCKKVNYKLRDWVFSRQRYWGEPIPLVHCKECGWVPISEKELPLLLPEISDFVPTDNGESPLVNATEWVETNCPKCGGKAQRETDTMPQWAGSSWYFLRYIDPHNDCELAELEKMKYWLPVDWYNGGNEHITLHLLYSRFWHKFLFDIGVVPTPEPYQKRTSHGMILGDNNEKMSKSRGNVVNPDDIVNEYGADTLRTYEMFMGAFEQSAPWSTEGVKGSKRFLDRVWKLMNMLVEDEDSIGKIDKAVHLTIKKVTEDYERMKFNTAIAAMMSLVNELYAVNRVTKTEIKTLLILLNPVAPHITEEMYDMLGCGNRLYNQAWPKFDAAKIMDAEVEVPIQINGKLRGVVIVPKDCDQQMIEQKVREDGELSKHVTGKTTVKVIYIPGKVFNIVLK